MPDSDRSIASMVSDIIGDVQQIVRAEVRLARAEIREELAKARRGVVFLFAGAVVVMMAFGVGLLSAVYALAQVWPPWAAALTVGGVVAIIGVVVLMTGMKQIKGVSLPPERTVSTIKDLLKRTS